MIRGHATRRRGGRVRWRRDPRVALSVVDLANHYRMAMLQRRVIEQPADESCRGVDPISFKSVGAPFPSRGRATACDS
jgi:hypothetical protein